MHNPSLSRTSVVSIVWSILLLACPLLLGAQPPNAVPHPERIWRSPSRQGARVQSPVASDPSAPLVAAEMQAEASAAYLPSLRWQQLAGPETGATGSLVVKGNRIFVGTVGGVFVSDDNGRSWQRSPRSPAQYSFGLLSVGNVLLYGTDGYSGAGGVVRSTDNGNSWQIVQNGIPANAGIFFLTTKGTSVFAGTRDGRVFRSDDLGLSWQAANKGLPEEFGFHPIAGSDFGLVIQFEQSLYRSADGNHWTPLTLPLPTSVTAHSPAAIRHILLVATTGAGVYLSDDGGNYWYAPNHGLPTNAVITHLQTDNNTVYCTTEDGTLYTSTDLGKTWQPKSSDFGIGKTLYGNHCIVQNGGALLASTWDGVYRSTDQGYTWQRSNRGFRAAEVYRVEGQGRRLYAATQGGPWVSEDNGKHWELRNNGMNPLPYFSQGAVAVAAVGGALFAGIQYDGLYRSYNQGRTWQRLEQGLPDPFEPFLIRAIGNKIYVGSYGEGMFVSSNGGDSWQRIKDLPTDGYYDAWQQIGNTILVGSYGAGLYRSTDNGNSWTPFTDGLTSDYVNDFLVVQNVVFAATDDGIFRLRADGNSWEEVRSYSQADTSGANGLAFVGGVIYATTYGKGIWASPDLGTTWQPENQGMLTNRTFSFSLIGGDLYVGSSGGGIFALRGVGRE